MINLESARKRVLIVDDEPLIGKVYGFKLKHCGYDVLTATEGAEAVELIHGQKPDIVLLDMVMPGMTGLDVLREVRTFSRVPVIIFTARNDMAQSAFSCGADDYVVKPLDPDRLVDKIRSFLNPDFQVNAAIS